MNLAKYKYHLLALTSLLAGALALMYFHSSKRKVGSVLFIGDSNTKANFSYADKIQASHPNLKVKKIAENGKNTSWMLEQLKKELSKNKYDMVAVLGGSNDIYGDVPLKTTEDNLIQMLKLIKASGAIAVFSTPPNKDFYTQKTQSRQDKLYSLVDWMKTQTFDVFINFHQLTGNKSLFSSSDGYLHPQSSAHKLLAEQLESKTNLQA